MSGKCVAQLQGRNRQISVETQTTRNTHISTNADPALAEDSTGDIRSNKMVESACNAASLFFAKRNHVWGALNYHCENTHTIWLELTADASKQERRRSTPKRREKWEGKERRTTKEFHLPNKAGKHGSRRFAAPKKSCQKTSLFGLILRPSTKHTAWKRW
jgi:hypothetical protein